MGRSQFREELNQWGTLSGIRYSQNLWAVLLIISCTLLILSSPIRVSTLRPHTHSGLPALSPVDAGVP